MKISAIAGICKKTKKVTRVSTNSGDWIGDGYSIYFVPELTNLDSDGLSMVFGMNEKQKENIIFTNEEINIDLTDTAENSEFEECVGDKILIDFSFSGKQFKTIKTDRTIKFILAKYLDPVSDMKETYQLFLRRSAATDYIVVKNGLLIQAVIMPYDLISTEFCERLNFVTNYCIEELHKKDRQRIAKTLYDDYNEGESDAE